jgi:O-antigen/teichoic acid export membrane protein
MLLRNSLWHLSGSAVPALVALATVPLLIRGVGLEGFGIITLITSVVGYFGIVDLNLSTGSIRYLSQFHANSEDESFRETFWFGLMFYIGIGLLGGVLLMALAATLLNQFFEISTALHDDALRALRIAALGFALTQLQNYLLVVPQAIQRYDRSAQGEAFFGVLVNVLSATVAMAGGGIEGVIAARVIVSAINTLWLVWLLRHLCIPLQPRWPGPAIRQALTSFSVYAYLSRLASLLHQHADKLIIGALAGPVALAFYAVPNQLASRVLGLTYRLGSVIYPRVSALAATGQREPLRLLYLDATRWLTYLNLAALGLIALTGEEFLRRWVGPAFVEEAYPVLLLVTLGLLLDSLTTIPSLVNDGLGHPRLTGGFALARGLIGVPLVYLGTQLAGIIGAASAHLLASVLMGTLFLVYVHGRSVPVTLADTWRLAWLPALGVGIAALLLVLPLRWLLPPGVPGLLMLAGAASLALLGFALTLLVNDSERATLHSAARRLLPGAC